jgi:hypothetical protein
MLRYLRKNPVIRERDADGVLMAAGFEWREFQSWIFEIFGTASIALFSYALACASEARTPSDFTSMVFLALIGCVLMCVCFGHIRRGIAFTRDGRVSLRGGVSNRLLLWGEIKEHAPLRLEASLQEPHDASPKCDYRPKPPGHQPGDIRFFKPCRRGLPSALHEYPYSNEQNVAIAMPPALPLATSSSAVSATGPQTRQRSLGGTQPKWALGEAVRARCERGIPALYADGVLSLWDFYETAAAPVSILYASLSKYAPEHPTSAMPRAWLVLADSW